MGYVTDEIRALIGVEGPVQTADLPLDAERLRRFVQGAMEDDPVHWDDEEARRRGYGDVVATPLFPLHASRRPSGTADPLDRFRDEPDWDGIGGEPFGGLPPLDLPLKRVLNGGTEARFHTLAKIGDVISSQSRYVDIYDRE